MGKYDPLKTFLLASDVDELVLGFKEIEALLGVTLPASQQYPAWWSNNPSNNVMTRVWLEAGYRTERLDLAARKVVFRRANRSRAEQGAVPPAAGSIIERLQRALGGTVRVAEGVDLTAATGEAWDAQAG